MKQLGFSRRPELLDELLALMSRDQHPQEVRELPWFSPSQQLSPTQPNPSWWGGEEKAKAGWQGKQTVGAQQPGHSMSTTSMAGLQPPQEGSDSGRQRHYSHGHLSPSTPFSCSC